MFLDDNDKSLSVRLDADLKKTINRIAENLGLSPENYTKTELFEQICKAAENRSKPKETVIHESKKEDLKRIKELEEQKEELETTVNNKDQDIEKLFETIQQHKELIIDFEKQNELLSNQLSETKTEHQESLENLREEKYNLEKRHFISLSNNELIYLNACLKSVKINKFFKSVNLEILSETDLLKKWFFYCANKEKYPFKVSLERFIRAKSNN